MNLYKNPSHRYCGMCSIPTRAPIASDLSLDVPLCGMCRARYERSQSKTVSELEPPKAPFIKYFSVPEVMTACVDMFHGSVKANDRMVLNTEESQGDHIRYDVYRDGAVTDLAKITFRTIQLKHLIAIGSLNRKDA